MSQTVYVVTDGDYSDYRICAICATLEMAEYAKRLYGADNDIEEWVLDELPEHPKGLLYFTVYMEHNGHVHSVGQSSPPYNPARTGELEPSWGGRMSCSVWAEDKQHAVKIVNEKRIQMLTEIYYSPEKDRWFKVGDLIA